MFCDFADFAFVFLWFWWCHVVFLWFCSWRVWFLLILADFGHDVYWLLWFRVGLVVILLISGSFFCDFVDSRNVFCDFADSAYDFFVILMMPRRIVLWFCRLRIGFLLILRDFGQDRYCCDFASFGDFRDVWSDVLWFWWCRIGFFFMSVVAAWIFFIFVAFGYDVYWFLWFRVGLSMIWVVSGWIFCDIGDSGYVFVILVSARTIFLWFWWCRVRLFVILVVADRMFVDFGWFRTRCLLIVVISRRAINDFGDSGSDSLRFSWIRTCFCDFADFAYDFFVILLMPRRLFCDFGGCGSDFGWFWLISYMIFIDFCDFALDFLWFYWFRVGSFAILRDSAYVCVWFWWFHVW